MTTKNTTPKIMIVDDEEVNRKLFSALCSKLDYNIIEAENGLEAVRKAEKERPDLILMDIAMPVMDGYTAIEQIKQNQRTKYIPIIIVSALDTHEDRIRGISAGASDFLSKPVNSEELFLRVRNNLKLKEYQDFLVQHNIILEEKVDERTKELKTAFDQVEEAHGKIKDVYRDTIFRLTLASEYKDKDTGSHILRISYYTKELAEHLGMDQEFSDTIFHASPMHDIGKVGIPDSVLLKPGKLTAEEWDIMKTHSTVGGNILKGSDSPYLVMAEEIALTHHERWDGTGYPNGLKGEHIPLTGRIMNIADQYDALRSTRPYKPLFDHETTVKILTEGDGRTLPGHFDPEILAAFDKLKERFRDIYDSQKEQIPSR